MIIIIMIKSLSLVLQISNKEINKLFQIIKTIIH